MTKRASPFEPYICRQLKVHINNYENDFFALKEIEERTRKKLIEGSKNLKTNFSTHQIKPLECPSLDFESHDSNRNLMQKCVTNYFTVNGKLINEKSNKAMTPEILNKCFFCDGKSNCIYKCVKCSEFYCSACSFTNYESLEDNRICISCS